MCIRYYYLVKQRMGEGGGRPLPRRPHRVLQAVFSYQKAQSPYLLGIPWKGRRQISLTRSLW